MRVYVRPCLPACPLTLCVVQGKPQLIIGTHRLLGKVVTLPKPLAVFKRHGGAASPTTGVNNADSVALKGNSGTAGETAGDANGAGGDAGEAGSMGDGHATTSTEYAVLGFVKKKLVFKERPRPIVRAAKRQRH